MISEHCRTWIRSVSGLNTLYLNDCCSSASSHNDKESVLNPARTTEKTTACPGCSWTGSCPSTCWCRSWFWPASGPASTSWSRACRTPTSGGTRRSGTTRWWPASTAETTTAMP